MRCFSPHAWKRYRVSFFFFPLFHLFSSPNVVSFCLNTPVLKKRRGIRERRTNTKQSSQWPENAKWSNVDIRRIGFKTSVHIFLLSENNELMRGVLERSKSFIFHLERHLDLFQFRSMKILRRPAELFCNFQHPVDLVDT